MLSAALFVMARVETTYLRIKRTLVKKQNHMHIIKFYEAVLRNKKNSMLMWCSPQHLLINEKSEAYVMVFHLCKMECR